MEGTDDGGGAGKGWRRLRWAKTVKMGTGDGGRRRQWDRCGTQARKQLRDPCHHWRHMSTWLPEAVQPPHGSIRALSVGSRACWC